MMAKVLRLFISTISVMFIISAINNMYSIMYAIKFLLQKTPYRIST